MANAGSALKTLIASMGTTNRDTANGILMLA